MGTTSQGSRGEPGYGGDSGHTGVQGGVNWCGKRWEEPASNPARAWTPANSTTKGPQGPEHGGYMKRRVREVWGQCVCEG